MRKFLFLYVLNLIDLLLPNVYIRPNLIRSDEYGICSRTIAHSFTWNLEKNERPLHQFKNPPVTIVMAGEESKYARNGLTSLWASVNGL